MKYAIQLPCTSFSSILLPLLKLKKKLNIRYGTEENGHFKGVSYYNVEKNIEDILLNIIPEVYRNKFKVLLMIINRNEIPPHIDSNALVVINLYLKTCGNTITTFYTENPDVPSDVIKIKNQTDGYILDDKNLIETCSFMAKEDEAWILNVKKPHSVKCQVKNELRIAFTLLSFTLSYEDTLKIFNIPL